MLEIEDLSFAYPGGPKLFEGLAARVPAGEVMAVVGRNGAGKSTMLRLINGLLRPTSGRVVAAGRQTADLKVHEISRLVGTLFQSPEQQLFAAKGFDEVAFGPRQFGLDEAVVRRRVEDALDRVGLSHAADLHPMDMDTTARRFLALASVLATDPPILLLDEPQRGLDRGRRERLEKVIAAELARNRTIVMICHDMNFVDRNAMTLLALGVAQPTQRPVDEFFASSTLTEEAGVERPAQHRVIDMGGAPRPIWRGGR